MYWSFHGAKNSIKLDQADTTSSSNQLTFQRLVSIHHLGSDITGHPAYLDYISTPGEGLWQDTSQQASWMESTNHCTSLWFKLDTSTVRLSKLIMGCYVNLTWSPPPYLVCLGWVSSHTKNRPVSETQTDLNNLMWMLAWVDFTEHS